MEFADVVRKRRMVRHFTPEPVPTEIVERIVRTAQRAPSAGYSQGISFVLVTDPATRRRIAEIAGEEYYVATMDHHFLPIGVVMIGHGASDVPSPSLKRGRRTLDDVLHRERW